jgi:hypothetical protein
MRRSDLSYTAQANMKVGPDQKLSDEEIIAELV